MSFFICPLAAPDLDAVLELGSRCSGAPQWSRSAYEAILAPLSGRQRIALVAKNQQALCGFAVASGLGVEVEAEVETVVVDAAYRRQGVGGALLRATMVAAAQAGATCMRLEVRASNAAALTLYKENGFAEIGIRHAYYCAPQEDAVLLQAALNSVQLQRPL